MHMLRARLIQHLGTIVYWNLRVQQHLNDQSTPKHSYAIQVCTSSDTFNAG